MHFIVYMENKIICGEPNKAQVQFPKEQNWIVNEDILHLKNSKLKTQASQHAEFDKQVRKGMKHRQIVN